MIGHVLKNRFGRLGCDHTTVDSVLFSSSSRAKCRPPAPWWCGAAPPQLARGRERGYHVLFAGACHGAVR
eukprot:scaffold15716_cov119-Isochrysis_galbana.AAC.5